METTAHRPESTHDAEESPFEEDAELGEAAGKKLWQPSMEVES